MPEPKKIEIIITEGDEQSLIEFWTYDYRIERDPIGYGYAPFSFICGPAYDVRMWPPRKKKE